jgi:virginiamycin B lyase
MIKIKHFLRSLAFLLVLAAPGKVGAVTGIFTEAGIPSASAGASGIVRGQDNGWWFTEFSGNKIGRFSFAGDVVEFPIPTPNSGPLGIASDSQAIWFTEFNANKIGRITPDGAVTEFAIPTPSSGPVGIAVVFGSVWFSESNVNKIGQLTQAGSFSEIAIPTPASGPMGVWGQGGVVWFTEFQGNKIGSISVVPPTSLTEVSVPTANAGPTSLSGDGAGRIWFTEATANKIGTLSQGVISEFPVPSGNSGLSGIVTDFFGERAWFTERSANRVGFVTTEGRFTEYMVPTPASEPVGITGFLFEGQVVFIERSGNAITRLQPDAAVMLAAKNAGGWTTAFDFANSENQEITVFGSPDFPPQRICPGACRSVISLRVGPHGSGKGTADQIDFGPFFGPLLFRSLEDGVLPGVKARLVNGSSPSKGIDIPVVRLSTIAALDPAVLVFPSALRTPAGGHSNLLISEVGSRSFLRLGPDTGLQVLIEAFSVTGQLVGSSTASLDAGGSVYLVDVLSQLGVNQSFGGQIRLTRVGGGGILWGYLITQTDDGAIGISLGATP